MKNISQREARRLRRENERLRGVIKDTRSRFNTPPSGLHLGYITLGLDSPLYNCISTAMKLKHACVMRLDAGEITIYALPNIDEKI
jgi:hypothetical protein